MVVKLQRQEDFERQVSPAHQLPFSHISVQLPLEHFTNFNHNTRFYPCQYLPKERVQPELLHLPRAAEERRNSITPTATNPLDGGRRLNSSTPRVLLYICRRSRWKFTDRKKHHGAGPRCYEISGFLFPFRGATFFSLFFFYFLQEKEKKKEKYYSLVAVMDGKDETLAR